MHKTVASLQAKGLKKKGSLQTLSEQYELLESVGFSCLSFSTLTLIHINVQVWSLNRIAKVDNTHHITHVRDMYAKKRLWESFVRMHRRDIKIRRFWN